MPNARLDHYPPTREDYGRIHETVSLKYVMADIAMRDVPQALIEKITSEEGA